jgi:hypothetical protein
MRECNRGIDQIRAKGCREFPINTSGGASERVLACQKAFTCAQEHDCAPRPCGVFWTDLARPWADSCQLGVRSLPGPSAAADEGPGAPHQDRIPLETGATCLGQKIEIDFVVAILKEDGLAPVAALRNMMRKPRNHDTSESSHTPTVALNRGIGIMSPISYFPSKQTLTQTDRLK